MSKVTRLTGGQGGEANRQGLHLREIPGEADRPLDTVGQDLRAARLRRGDELGRISQALRIRKDYLEAIESDRTDKLPGRRNARGLGGKGDSCHDKALLPKGERVSFPGP